MNSDEVKEFVQNFLDNHIHGALMDSFWAEVQNATMEEDEQTREDLCEELDKYTLKYERNK